MKRRFWTAAEDLVLREAYPHLATALVAGALARSVSAIYGRAQGMGLEKSPAYLASPAACRLRRGDNVGRATRFPKGHVPANKGLRRPGYAPGRMAETQFKPGSRHGTAAARYQPIGAERVSKDGYLERKVHDGLPMQSRWRAVHLLVWEAAHGPVPRGHAISFRNGDRRDIRLDNLACIPRAELMRRNTLHRYPSALVSAMQLRGALVRRIRRQLRADDAASPSRSAA